MQGEELVYQPEINNGDYRIVKIFSGKKLIFLTGYRKC
jgi:hypothetical protein